MWKMKKCEQSEEMWTEQSERKYKKGFSSKITFIINLERKNVDPEVLYYNLKYILIAGGAITEKYLKYY